VDNIIDIKNKIKDSVRSKNYVDQGSTEENMNLADKYDSSGESEFSRGATHPLDEILSERHYFLSSIQSFLRDRFLLEKGYEGVPPKGFQRADDRILEDANEALMRSRRVDPSEIAISVKEGILTLNGTVPHRAMKKFAESTVEKIYGVKDVQNSLTISAHGKPLIDNRTGLN
jgi:hypothetical protein